MQRACPACAAVNPADARFCFGCGAGLTGPSPPPAAPATVRTSAWAERRLVTVMFCDLADSTDMSTRLDPEDYRDAIVAYQRAAAREIERFGGFVAKYMGDGIVAYYGYPSASEDDAERAVRAGLEVVQAVEALTSPAGPLCARVGIASGSVIIGDLIGEGSARENAISGETPNLAARLQALAVGGGVVISASTQVLVGALFDYDPLGPVDLKGFKRPQPAFRVRASNDRMSRFEALRSQAATFVGREEELAILMRRWARTCGGDSQIALISADAGVGKSRLVAMFRQHLQGEEHQAQTAYCAPFARNSAFYPFVRALEDRCAFAAADSSERKLDKLEALVADALGAASPEAVRLIADLLSLDVGDRYPPTNLNPQRLKEETTQILAELTLASAKTAPALVFIEDIHWIDPSSLEVLRVIGRELKSGGPLMMLLSFRPEFVPPEEWFGQPSVTNLTLSRLRGVEAEAMVTQIAGAAGLGQATIRQILEHADGVPLYLEEITRAVLEDNEAGARNIDDVQLAPLTVPATLQASLLARLDRLSCGREVAQVAAAIGREFPASLLAVVSDQTETDLSEAIQELIKSDLIRAKGSGRETTFVFRHALIQDIAYGALLRGARQTLHDRIASALIDEFPDQAQARPEFLARHLVEAGRAAEAVGAWRRAAVRTLRGGSWNEGMRQLAAGLGSVATLPAGAERDRLELDLQMMVGGVAMGAVGHSAPAAQAAYERAYKLARELNEPRNAALAGGRLWLSMYGAGDLEGFKRLAERILLELGPPSDPIDHAIVRSTLSTPPLFGGRFAEAEEICLATLAPLDAIDHRVAPEEYYYMSPATGTWSAFQILHLVNGRMVLWEETCDRAYREHETLGAMGGIISLSLMIYARYVANDWGRLPSDLDLLDRDVSRIEGASHYLNLSQLVRSRLATRAGRTEGLEAVARIMAGSAVSFAMQHLPRYQMIAGDAYADMGHIEEARRYYLEALKGGSFGSQQWLRSELLRRLGDLEAATNPASARDRYEEALAVARDQHAPLFELRAALALARLRPSSGGGDADEAALRSVCDRLADDSPDLRQAREYLADRALGLPAI